MKVFGATILTVYIAAILGAYSLYGNDGITLTVGIPAIFLFTFFSIAWPFLLGLFVLWMAFVLVAAVIGLIRNAAEEN